MKYPLIIGLFLWAGAAQAGPALAERFMNELNISPAMNMLAPGGDLDTPVTCPSATEPGPLKTQEQAISDIRRAADKWKTAKKALLQVAACHQPFRADPYSKTDNRPSASIQRKLTEFENRVVEVAGRSQSELREASTSSRELASTEQLGTVNSCSAFEAHVTRMYSVSSQLWGSAKRLQDLELNLSFAQEDSSGWSDVTKASLRSRPEEALDNRIEKMFKISRLPANCADSFQKGWQQLVEDTRALAKAIGDARKLYVAPLDKQVSAMATRADCQRKKGDCRM